MKQVLFLSGLFSVAACGTVSLRHPICDPNTALVPRELDGTYQMTLPASGLDLGGVQTPMTSIVKFSAREQSVRIASDNGMRAFRSSSGIDYGSKTGAGSFCRMPTGGYLLQSLSELTNTWTLSKVVVHDSGFSIVPLSFHPDKLTELGIRYLVVEKVDDESVSENFDIVIDNTRKNSGEVVSSLELLSIAQPLSMSYSFTRISETPRVRQLLKTKGRSFGVRVSR